MCYLCHPKPTAAQRSTRRAITDAQRVWRRKECDESEPSDRGFRKSWGYMHDWTVKPRNRCW